MGRSPEKMPEVLISLVIPAHNEEKRILATLEKTVAYLSARYPFEIIVVNDHSSDATRRLVEDFSGKNPVVRMLDNPGPRGKGVSVRHGVLASAGKYVLFSDADLSTPIEEFEKFLPELEKGAEVVIASRQVPGARIKGPQPLLRRLMGKIFRVIRRSIAVPEIRDTQCGFKCFERNAALRIFSGQQLTGFVFDVEILIIAKKCGYKIKEMPVTWTDSPESKLGLLDPLRMLVELIKIRGHN